MTIASSPLSVLVTGAAGFVGRRLVPALRAALPREARVWTLDRMLSDRTRDDGFVVDLADEGEVRAAIRKAAPTCCVHLAGVTHPVQAASDEPLTWRTNLHATLGLAQSLWDEAPSCTLFYISTGDVYEGSPAVRAAASSEQSPLRPTNVYSASKAAADLALGARAAQGQRVIRFRPFNQTGAGQPRHLVTPHIAAQIAAAEAGLGPAVIRLSAPDVVRDFMDVRDACRAYVQAVLAAPGLENGAVFNLGSGVARSIRSLAADLATRSALAFDIQDRGGSRRSEPEFLCADARLAASALGWAATRPWAETLDEVLADWRIRIQQEAGQR